MKKWISELNVVENQSRSLIEKALVENGGILSLAHCWVPSSFLHPGNKLQLHPSDIYVCRLERRGIDERWFASTTEAANEGRLPDEGLSYVVFYTSRVSLKVAVEVLGSPIPAYYQ